MDWIKVEENGEMIWYEDQGSVKWKIMENNERCFCLTESTPPMTAPLVNDLGYLGNTEGASHILQGTYACPPGVDQHTKDFLLALQVTEPIHPEEQIEPSVLKEDFQAYWKKARERTLSSCSGLHFGHYIVASNCDYLSELHALFTELVVSTTYPPERWQNGLLVMLKKKAGCRDLDKL